MFRNFLSTDTALKNFKIEWVKKLGGLIRVIVFDSDTNSHKAFVTIYHEQKNQYLATAFDVRTGEIFWTTSVPRAIS